MHPRPLFTPSMPVPQSVAQAEQARQTVVEGYRSGLYGPYPESPATDRWYADIWKPLAVCVVALAMFAIGHRCAELDATATRDSLEARIAALEARDVLRGNEIAAIEGNVQEKIDAYAMLEASAMVTKIEQQEGK